MMAGIWERLPGGCWMLAVAAGLCFEPRGRTGEYFLFTSFRGNGEDGLHLAVSTNGYRWDALNGDRSFLKPEVGAYKIMRDPCLAEGPDGTFHLVWTSGWTAEEGKIIGYAHSKDLIGWSEQRAIAVMEKEPLKNNLRYAVGERPDGPFGKPSEPFTGDWVEGPSVIKIKDEYLVYFDRYAEPPYYGAARSKDLKHWEDCSGLMRFPTGHRHGTVLKVREEVARAFR
jgi:hypothetical protein